MIFSNTINVVATKFTLLYKIILCIFITLLVFTGIGVATIMPTLHNMMHELNHLHLIKSTLNYVSGLLHGMGADPEVTGYINLDQLLGKFHRAGEIVYDYSTQVTVSFVVVVLLFYLFCLSVSIQRYTTTSVVHTFMSCNGVDGFASNLFRNLRKSIIFGLACTSFSILYYIVTLGMSVGLGILITKANGYLGVLATYLFIMLSLSSKRALFATWLPNAVVKDMRVMEAFKKSMRDLPKTFWENWGDFIFFYFVFTVIGVTSIILTMGLAAIIITALGLLFLQVYELVFYYHHNNLKFYIDNQRVIDPTKEYKDAVIEDEAL